MYRTCTVQRAAWRRRAAQLGALPPSCLLLPGALGPQTGTCCPCSAVACVCMCVHVCACACMCVHVCACVCIPLSPAICFSPNLSMCESNRGSETRTLLACPCCPCRGECDQLQSGSKPHITLSDAHTHTHNHTHTQSHTHTITHTQSHTLTLSQSQPLFSVPVCLSPFSFCLLLLTTSPYTTPSTAAKGTGEPGTSLQSLAAGLRHTW